MAKRTITATESSISLPAPNGCYYDFTKTPEETPHAVRISVPPKSTFKGHRANWNEQKHSLYTPGSDLINGKLRLPNIAFQAGKPPKTRIFSIAMWKRATTEGVSKAAQKQKTPLPSPYPPAQTIGIQDTSSDMSFSIETGLPWNSMPLSTPLSPQPRFQSASSLLYLPSSSPHVSAIT